MIKEKQTVATWTFAESLGWIGERFPYDENLDDIVDFEFVTDWLEAPRFVSEGTR